EPLVLEEAEAGEVVVALHLPPGIPSRAGGEVEPERRARRGVEVPGHDLADPAVERVAPARAGARHRLTNPPRSRSVPGSRTSARGRRPPPRSHASRTRRR